MTNTASTTAESCQPRERVFCPACKADGKRSRVFDGGTATTLMSCSPYYDEEGRYHCHDRNVRTTKFSCSQGHAWETQSSGSCWCGWQGGGASVTQLPAREVARYGSLNVTTAEKPKSFTLEDAIARSNRINAST